VPEQEALRVPEGGRVLLAFGGLVTVVLSGMFFMCVGAFSLANPALELNARCGLLLDWLFVRHWFLTLPCMIAVWGGMFMLVTAAVGRNRFLFTSGAAVVLTWLLVGALFGWLLYH
jgi:hypothetical protein